MSFITLQILLLSVDFLLTICLIIPCQKFFKITQDTISHRESHLDSLRGIAAIMVVVCNINTRG